VVLTSFALSGADTMRLNVIIVLAWLALIPSVWCAYRLLGALASAYRSKRFSDAQLQMLLWFVLMALPLVTNVIFSSAGPTAPPILILASIPVAATAIALWLVPTPSSRTSQAAGHTAAFARVRAIASRGATA
jgi:hypothetical protein